jgi:hypothetical protein
MDYQIVRVQQQRREQQQAADLLQTHRAQTPAGDGTTKEERSSRREESHVGHEQHEEHHLPEEPHAEPGDPGAASAIYQQASPPWKRSGFTSEAASREWTEPPVPSRAGDWIVLALFAALATATIAYLTEP